jgi:hypothetical protein
MPTIIALAALLLTADPAPTAREQSDKEGSILENPLCQPFSAALKEATRKGMPLNPERILDAQGTFDALVAAMGTIRPPAGADEKAWSYCRSEFERGLPAFRVSAIETEATVTLRQLMTGIQERFEGSRKLCPATQSPVPAKLELVADGKWSSTRKDWEDMAWMCAGEPKIKHQRFQYEMVSPKTGTLELIARGYPAGDGKLVTLVLPGKVTKGKLEFGALIRR